MNQKRLKITSFISYLKLFFELTILIFGYLIYKTITLILWPFPGRLSKKFANITQTSYHNFVNSFERSRNHSINRLNLIELSVQNLASKKTRTLITVGGMALGVGSIVFLVSIGYGLQELIISRVARLEELKQTDVIAQPNSELKINDQALAQFYNLQEIDDILPLISVVGKVSYKEAVSDMAVYGVTSKYLQSSAIQPVRGAIFESDDLAKIIFEPEFLGQDESEFLDENRNELSGEVAGAEVTLAEFGTTIGEVQVEIEPDAWLRVRSGPSRNSKVLGYTTRCQENCQEEQENFRATQVWGGSYPDTPSGSAGRTTQGQDLGKWVKALVYLWEIDENGGYHPLLGEHGEQLQEVGYMAQLKMKVVSESLVRPVGVVLGISETATAESTTQALTATDTEASNDTQTESNGEWVDLPSESAQAQAEKIQQIALGENAKQQAVVNRAMLTVMGIDENKAIGEKIEASFVVMGKDLDLVGEKIESIPGEYEIVGVIPGDRTPMFFVPFLDLRSLGIVNYSQAKLVATDQQVLSLARQKIEAMGFVTRSVMDTVDQIESIFATTRIVLGLLGMAALMVATLGMFNTLTVSLLERTREVGLMKALGMKSNEVNELFLIESLTMGLLGGIFGIALGFIAGKLVSIVLSIFAVTQGLGMMNIAVIPLSFIGLIVFLAIFVGIVTGLYPARRARNISALNALRYE